MFFALWYQSIFVLLRIFHHLNCGLGRIWLIHAEHSPQSMLHETTGILGADEGIFPWWREVGNISQRDFLCSKVRVAVILISTIGGLCLVSALASPQGCMAVYALLPASAINEWRYCHSFKSQVIILDKTSEFPHMCIWLLTWYIKKKNACVREWGSLRVPRANLERSSMLVLHDKRLIIVKSGTDVMGPATSFSYPAFVSPLVKW